MPRIVDHDERRKQVADALLEIVAEAGIGAATVRAVADRSGWSTGVISHYFANRHALLVGGLRRAAELAATRQREIGKTMTGSQAVEAILEEVLPMDKRRLSLNRIFMFFYAEAVVDPVMLSEIDGYLSKWRRQVARAIKDAQELDHIDPSLDTDAVARDLVGLTDGLSVHALFNEKILQAFGKTSPVRFWVSRLAPGQGQASKKIPQSDRTPSSPKKKANLLASGE